jgi:hypothetical protein
MSAQIISKEGWKSEYKILIQKHTWILMGLPPKRSIINIKWLYCHKYKFEKKNITKKLKAYLIACGFTQQLKVFFFNIKY